MNDKMNTILCSIFEGSAYFLSFEAVVPVYKTLYIFTPVQQLDPFV